MKKNPKLSTSEIDGVEYRKAKTWQIILSQLFNGSASIFYSLVGLMSYLGNNGYGIAMAAIGYILTVTRVFDGLIDPFLALMIDKVNTRFGKLRLFMGIGWLLRSAAMLMLFVWSSNQGYGAIFFVIMYSFYIVGSSIYDISGNMIPAVMTNDPKQRPMIMVWNTVYSYVVPTFVSILTAMVILPKFGNQYTSEMLSTAALLYVPISLIFAILCMIGVSEVDKPENFQGTAASQQENLVGPKDMLRLFKRNRPFQMYIVSSVAAKLGQQTASQAIISTLLFGIMIGNIQLGTLISSLSMFPAIIFSIVGARYAGKHGNKATTVNWTIISLVISVISVIYLAVIDTRWIATNMLHTTIFFILLMIGNGAKMCITVANGAMRADVIDYELDSSGKFIPGTINATYNFVDQILTSFGATIAALGVAFVGYKTTVPQPTDMLTTPIKWMTIFLYFGVPMLGWLIGLVCMKYYKLDKSEMVNVQKRISDKKAQQESTVVVEDVLVAE